MHDHDHEHEHDHHHDEHSHGLMHTHGPLQGPVMWISLVLTLSFVIFEAGAGWYAKSLALMSDAGHNFSDAFAVGLAAYAVWVGRRPANARKTFGYHRVAILTALINAGALIVIAIGIMVEAFDRFRHPVPINDTIMLIVAAVAVVMHAVVAALLHRGSHDNLNVKAVYIHMAGDALSGLAVIAAALVYRYTRWMEVDAIVSGLIGVFILWSSWGIVREATDILLDAAPKGLDLDAILDAIREVKHVIGVHDVHVWAVSDGMNYLSCHVEVDSVRTMDEIDAILFAINTLLDNRFGIKHPTIQTERVGSCTSTSSDDPLFCDDHITSAQAAGAANHAHDHI